MTTPQFINGLLDWLLADPTHIVAAASVLAATTPTPDPETWAGKLYRVVDIFAVNVLHAKDAGATNPPTAPSPIPASGPASAFGSHVGTWLAAALGLAVAACQGEPPATALFDIRAAYDGGVLVPVVAYHGLGVCSDAVKAPCRDGAIDAQLVKADQAAKAALDAAEDTIRQHPQMDSAAALAAAENAVKAVQTILATYAIH